MTPSNPALVEIQCLCCKLSHGLRNCVLLEGQPLCDPACPHCRVIREEYGCGRCAAEARGERVTSGHDHRFAPRELASFYRRGVPEDVLREAKAKRDQLRVGTISPSSLTDPVTPAGLSEEDRALVEAAAAPPAEPAAEEPTRKRRRRGA